MTHFDDEKLAKAKGSAFSVPFIERVRYTLGAYMRWQGLTAYGVFGQLDGAIGTELAAAIGDRKSITDFLNGARLGDEKIEALIKYLEFVDPVFASAIPIDGQIRLLGQTTEDFYSGSETKLAERMDKEATYLRDISGLYASAIVPLKLSSDLTFLYIRRLEGTLFCLSQVFYIRGNDNADDDVHGAEFVRRTNKIVKKNSRFRPELITDQGRIADQHDIEEIVKAIKGIPLKAIDAVSPFSENVNENERWVDQRRSRQINLCATGVCVRSGFSYVLIMREHLYKYPVFSEIMPGLDRIVLKNLLNWPVRHSARNEVYYWKVIDKNLVRLADTLEFGL